VRGYWCKVNCLCTYIEKSAKADNIQLEDHKSMQVIIDNVQAQLEKLGSFKKLDAHIRKQDKVS
jgi:hypothetical protein